MDLSSKHEVANLSLVDLPFMLLGFLFSLITKNSIRQEQYRRKQEIFDVMDVYRYVHTHLAVWTQ